MCNVDLSTGRLSLSAVDFSLPGRVPLEFKRHYRSTNVWQGDLGYGWSHPFGVALWQSEDGGLVFRGSDGRRIPFVAPDQGQPSQQPTEQISLHYFPADHLPWPVLHSELSSGVFGVQWRDQPTLLFDARPHGGSFPWRAIAARSENLVLVYPGPHGLPAEIRDANGRTLYLLRNAAGHLVEIRLADGEMALTTLARYQYDGNSDLVAVSDPAGTRTYAYLDHLLVGHRDRCGGACQSAFDVQGRCFRTNGPGGILKRTYTFEPERNATTEEDSLGNVSRYKYSQTQKTIETVDPAGGVSRFFYDAQDRLVMAVNQMGYETSICYDADGSPRGKIRPDGSVIGIETDALGEVSGFTFPGGARLRFQRDEQGRVVEQTVASGGKYSYTYAANGDLTGIQLPSGKEATLEWTPDGRIVSELDARGVLTQQHFDGFFRLSLLRDAVGATTHYSYDSAGHLQAIEHPDGTRRRFQYDAEGHLIALEDEAGHVTRWSFDDAGRRARVILPDGQAIIFRYDSENHLVEVEAPGGLRQRLAYDSRGLLVWQQFADGRVEEYQFDASGLLVKLTDSSGAAVDVERDKLGLIRRIVYPGGAEKKVVNDAAGRWARVGCDGHVLERKISDKNCAVSERQDEFVLTRAFSETGRVTEVADGAGAKVRFEYDEIDRVAAIQTTIAGSEPRSHRFEYDRVGNQVVWSMPSGKVERKAYDLLRRVVEQSVWLGEKLLLRRRYRYDPMGRLAVLHDSRRGEQTFSYDALGRLLSVRGSSGASESYQYSEAGDVLADGMEYAPGNRVVATRRYRLHYDARGFVSARVSAAGVDEFSHTWNGLLREVKLADGRQIRYEYDPHYRLVQRTLGDFQIGYEWNEEQLWSLKERDKPPLRFVYLPQSVSPLEQQIGGECYSIHTDHVGKIQELIDDSGQIVWQYEGNAWGESTQSASAAGITCPFGFPGQIRDVDLGICYNRFRTYFPEAAHFLSPDPVGLWAGIDQYRYSFDPVNFVDPDGLKCRGKTDDPTLYRGDRRPPDEICAQGFVPQNPSGNLSVFEHVEAKRGSQWVSTSYDFKTAQRFSQGGPVYIVSNPGCGNEVDCDPEVQAKYGDPEVSEYEIAFNKSIPPGNILGFHPPLPGGGHGAFQACP